MFELNKYNSYLEVLFSLTLIITCIITNILSPYCVCTMENCQDLVSIHVKAVFPRIIAIVCMISRIKIIFDIMKNGFYNYGNKIKEYEICFPKNVHQTNDHRMFVLFIVSLYAAIVLPINALRIYKIYYEVQENTVLVFFVLMYLQNWSICSIEVHFIVLCFGLYQKFYEINEDMLALKSETIVSNKYPSVLQFAEPFDFDRIQNISYNNNDVITSIGIRLRLESRTIELLRIKHQFVRDVISDLNSLYSVQLALSLCALCVMIIIDIYGEIFTINARARSKLFLYGWLVQYFFRFCAIIMVTHLTTKQAYKTKKLVSDVNNRNLDDNTKEELFLFFNQIFRRSVEYTTYDIFTLNANLITSAIAVGTTYFIVLMQLQRKISLSNP